MKGRHSPREWERSLDPHDSEWPLTVQRWLWWCFKVLLLLGFVMGLIVGVTMLMLILISLVAPVEGGTDGW